jgi:pimeloyl-ACP methyl ester carboxylesterase
LDAVLTELSVQGIPTRMLRGGSGPRVLFLHGAAGLTGWSEFFRLLSRTHEIWFPEHPGFGLTPASPAIATTAELAAYYREFVREARLGEFHLIGSSFGGWLGAELAILDDVPLRSMTLIGPAGLRPRLATTPPANEEEFVRRLYWDQTVADRVLAEPLDEDERQVQKRNRSATGRLGGSFHNPELEPALRRATTPALVLWGEYDQLVPAEQAQLWHSCLHRSELSVFPRCGHLPHFEQPATVASRVEEFLSLHR